MRVICSSGVTPIEFYDLTYDEAIIAYKAKVDEWAFFRNGFGLVHCSLGGKMADVIKAIPLPFDNEVEEQVDDLVSEYNRLRGENG